MQKQVFSKAEKNSVTVTVATENEDGTKNTEGISRAYDFIEKWRCEDASKDLPVQYVRF